MKEAQAILSKASGTRLLAVFVAMMVVFTFLAWRGEQSDHRIRANTARIAATTANLSAENDAHCHESRARALRLNAFADTMAALEVTNTSIDDSLRAARIRAYRAMKRLPVPVCSTS